MRGGLCRGRRVRAAVNGGGEGCGWGGIKPNIGSGLSFRVAIAHEGGAWCVTGQRGTRVRNASVHNEIQRLPRSEKGVGLVRARRRHAQSCFGPTTRTPGMILHTRGEHDMPRARVVPVCALRAYTMRSSGSAVPQRDQGRWCRGRQRITIEHRSDSGGGIANE